MEQVPDVQWEFRGDKVYTECDADYPNLWFMFESKWLEVSAKDYVKSTNSDRNLCQLSIQSVDLPFNTLGMPLLIDYYSVHDPVSGKISFAPHSASQKSEILIGS